jgi:hypothetical protein
VIWILENAIFKTFENRQGQKFDEQQLCKKGFLILCRPGFERRPSWARIRGGDSVLL